MNLLEKYQEVEKELAEAADKWDCGEWHEEDLYDTIKVCVGKMQALNNLLEIETGQ